MLEGPEDSHRRLTWSETSTAYVAKIQFGHISASKDRWNLNNHILIPLSGSTSPSAVAFCFDSSAQCALSSAQCVRPSGSDTQRVARAKSRAESAFSNLFFGLL